MGYDKPNCDHSDNELVKALIAAGDSKEARDAHREGAAHFWTELAELASQIANDIRSASSAEDDAHAAYHGAQALNQLAQMSEATDMALAAALMRYRMQKANEAKEVESVNEGLNRLFDIDATDFPAAEA